MELRLQVLKLFPENYWLFFWTRCIVAENGDYSRQCVRGFRGYILMADSIRYSIRTQMADSQVPNIHRVHANKNPLKILENREGGESRDSPNF